MTGELSPITRWVAYDSAFVVVATGLCLKEDVAQNVAAYPDAVGYVLNLTYDATPGLHEVDPATGVISLIIP